MNPRTTTSGHAARSRHRPPTSVRRPGVGLGAAAAGADDLDQLALGELSCAQCGHRRIEVEHEHRIGARFGEQARALVEGGQAEMAGVRLEEALGVRIEGGDDRRTALGASTVDRAADHGLVPEVESVEIAERDDPAAKRGGKRRAVVQTLHGGGYREGRLA